MTPYEIARLWLAPFFPALPSKVRRSVVQLLDQSSKKPTRILDVGGRTSPYTVGLPAKVTITELSRTSNIQNYLHLGLTPEITSVLKRRRSNIEAVIFQDMTQSTLPNASFDGVVCVEVIEHVLEDERFVQQIARVLKPGGWLCLTTPNGDYIRNEPPEYNPDHVRHYTKEQLSVLLQPHFRQIKVTWEIKTGKFRYRGLRSMNLRQPFSAISIMLNNLVSQRESRHLEQSPNRRAHLFVVAQK